MDDHACIPSRFCGSSRCEGWICVWLDDVHYWFSPLYGSLVKLSYWKVEEQAKRYAELVQGSNFHSARGSLLEVEEAEAAQRSCPRAESHLLPAFPAAPSDTDNSAKDVPTEARCL